MLAKHQLWRRREERILNVNGDGCDRKKIAGRRIRRELKIRESEKVEHNNHNNPPAISDLFTLRNEMAD